MKFFRVVFMAAFIVAGLAIADRVIPFSQTTNEERIQMANDIRDDIDAYARAQRAVADYQAIHTRVDTSRKTVLAKHGASSCQIDPAFMISCSGSSKGK